MRFSIALGLAAAVASVAAVPVDSKTLQYAKHLYKRNGGNLLAKRNNGGSSSSSSITDADILNFALNLEYLEAQFYHIAAYGTQLPQSILNGTGNRGYVRGNAGSKVPFSSDLTLQYAIEIAQNEQDHVTDLRAGLGDAAVAMPEIDLNSSFTAAAQAAGIIGMNETFDAFASETNFFLAAFLFEDTGVTAYNGAAPLIKNKDYLAVAASILAVEAYHAAAIRVALITANQNDSSVSEAANKAAAAESLLGNGGMTNLTVNGKPVITNANNMSLAFARTPGNVLNIAYLNTMSSSATKGGFFPNGLNGNIKTASGVGSGGTGTTYPANYNVGS